MPNPRVCVLSGAGLNCEYETAHAFELAGARAECVLLGRLAARPTLRSYDILAIPGGFSYGDDLGSGRVLGLYLRTRVPELAEFIADGKPVIGICNGFQTLVKAGYLPGINGAGRQEATLTANSSGRFEDRWVRLRAEPDSPCLFTRGISGLELPVRHGEGRFAAPESVLEAIETENLVALRYASPDGADPAYPHNPNGSPHAIAGICNRAGNVLGLMPHPEAFVRPTQHPRWTREPVREGLGLALFRNAVEYAKGR